MMLAMNPTHMEARNIPNLSTTQANANIPEVIKDNLTQNQLQETIVAQEKELESIKGIYKNIFA